MLTCKFCGKCLGSKSGLATHENHCKENPNRKIIVRTGKGSSLEKEKERLRKITEKAKLNNGGYRPGSGRGKKGWYKGIFCDSSWELAYVVYHIDNSISIERCNVVREYLFNGEIKKYHPDFIVNGKIIEIKGYCTKQWQAKQNSNQDVDVLYKDDMKFYLEYVISKYGKNFISLYE